MSESPKTQPPEPELPKPELPKPELPKPELQESGAAQMCPQGEGPRPALRGRALILDFARQLKNGPGVYRMLDENGRALYVGKARALQKRVTSYTRPQRLSARILRMIDSTCAMEVVSTHTESEALLLEANLIKRLRPPYNVLLRDDKSFPHILISADHEAPGIFKHRGARRRAGAYFGPFASASAVNVTILALQKAFRLRNCSDSFYANRTRPCLLHQIKRCAAPCTGEISLGEYGELVAGARQFLSGNNSALQRRMAREMEQAARNLDYEKAAIHRDRIRALAQIGAGQSINPQHVKEADLFALALANGQACVQVFFFRAGQNWGNNAWFPQTGVHSQPSDILSGFIAQFYDARPCPPLLVVSHPLDDVGILCAALSQKSGRTVRIAVPHRGEKKELVTHALRNAEQALARRFAQASAHRRLLGALAQTFALDAAPRRIEIFDNSHISGTRQVGAMVVYGPDGLDKAQYRKFNIRSAGAGDDYAMMREVLTRRFARLAGPHGSAEDQGEGTNGADRPDLLLIDGGQGQLNVAVQLCAQFGLDIPVIAIAKGPNRNAGEERFFRHGHKPVRLAHNDPVLYLVQRLRDEAHRFAIGAQRARRAAAMSENPVEAIAGIGARRRAALLRHFGSSAAIARAGVNDLAKAPGVSRALARRIYDHFHER